MNVIQKISLPIKSTQHPLNLYISESGYSGRLRINEFNEIILEPYSTLSTDTWMNSFPSAVIRNMIKGNIFVSITGSGISHWEVWGVTSKSNVISKKLVLTEFKLNEKILIPEISFNYMYVKIYTTKKIANIINISWHSDSQRKRENKIAYGIATYQRVKELKKLVSSIASTFEENSNDHIFISDNASQGISFKNSRITVFQQENVGGAGGFSRGIEESLKGGYEYVVLFDDDAWVHPETIHRMRFLLDYCDDSFLSLWISGSMLQAETPHIMYESGAVLLQDGFQHINHGLDISNGDNIYREFNQVISRGDNLVGWWFAVIPTRSVLEKGLPLPIFIRGDDIEYAIRAQPEVLRICGFGVWHPNFVGKYNPIFESYYLPRNLILLGALHPHFERLAFNFTFKQRFFRHLITYNYSEAYLMIQSMKDIVEGTILNLRGLDHQRILEIGKKYAPSKFQENSVNQLNVFERPKSKVSIVCLIFLSFFGVDRGKGLAAGGFDRQVTRFAGRKVVFVTSGKAGILERAQFSRARFAILLFEYIKMRSILKVKRGKIHNQIISQTSMFSDLNVGR